MVSYHLNKVLWREHHLVEVVDSVHRRGAVERFYRLKRSAWGDLHSVAESMESEVLEQIPLGECLLEAVEAMESESFGSLEGSACQWFSVAVDDKGWQEVLEAREEFNKRVEAAVARGRKRAEGSARSGKRYEIVVGAAAFPSARAIADG